MIDKLGVYNKYLPYIEKQSPMVKEYVAYDTYKIGTASTQVAQRQNEAKITNQNARMNLENPLFDEIKRNQTLNILYNQYGKGYTVAQGINSEPFRGLNVDILG